MHRFNWRVAVTLVAIVLVATGVAASSKKKKIAELPVAYQEWLAEVKPLMSEDELRLFLELEKDYQRDAFIERFWKSRDDFPETQRSEFKERFYERLAAARELYGNEVDDRYRALILNGEPHDVLETDCGLILWPIQIWHYGYSDTLSRPFKLLFYQRGAGGPFRLWVPAEGFAVLVAMGSAEFEAMQGGPTESFVVSRYLRERCIDDRVEELIHGINEVKSDGPVGAMAALSPARPPDAEWLETFQHFSTDLPVEASLLDARFAVSFPGTRQSRTVVQALLAVPVEQASVVEIEGYRAYNFQLTGEVLRGDELFETFRYRFDLPAEEATEGELPLFFERALRPGAYRFVLKLEDVNGQRFHRLATEVEVPSLRLETMEAAAAEEVVEVGPAVELVEPGAAILTGAVRFDAVVRGDAVRKVAFALDGKALLTKKRPPFSIDVSLGDVPRTHTLTAVAYDAEDREVARDELLVNAGQHHFSAEIVEPQGTVPPGAVARVRVEVETPEGAAVERVELYRDDFRLATLYSAPYVQPLRIETRDEIVVLRAVAFLADGNSTEDVVLLNAPGVMEETDVRLVELYTTVMDAAGRPRRGLVRGEFTILENGVEQELLRFDRLDDLPIHAALLIDTSASMQENLERVNQAALRFLRSTITAKDRAAIITFSEQPFLAAPLTSDMQELARALAGLKAERSTALYDSIVYSLFYLKGITGQRALLVLSDGEDRLSEHAFDETLELAAREGVTIYAVGIELKKLSEGRRRLTRLAEETGGRSFFIQSVDELDVIYDAIQAELRSQYLLAYQSSHGREDDGFRVVEVKVSSGGAARTLRGYYP